MWSLMVLRASSRCPPLSDVTGPASTAALNIHHRFLSSRKAHSGRKNKSKGPRKLKQKKSEPRRIPKTRSDQIPAAQSIVPPVFLRVTASPFAYVASCAVSQHEIDPKALFIEEERPPSFSKVDFQYVSPKTFGHELPSLEIPEVSFLGRSNVGKSSLLNALTNSDLARCSKQPGRTQQVNYFGIFDRTATEDTRTNANAFLVDLPGYGFAQAPGALVHGWQKTTQDYLLQRRDSGQMRRVYLLVDARRGPVQLDRIIMGWFDEAEMEYAVVLTKADRVSQPQIVKCVNEVCMRYCGQLADGYDHQGPVVHVTSARDGLGLRELMISIDAEFLGYRERDVKIQKGFGELR